MSSLIRYLISPVLGIVSGLAILAGAGGGGIYVSVLYTICEFSIHQATSLSQLMMASAAISGLYHNIKQERLDTNLVLFFAPIQMAGAQVGSILNNCLIDSSHFVLY